MLDAVTFRVLSVPTGRFFSTMDYRVKLSRATSFRKSETTCLHDLFNASFLVSFLMKFDAHASVYCRCVLLSTHDDL